VSDFNWAELRDQLEQQYTQYRADVAAAFQADPSGSAAPAFPNPYGTPPLSDLSPIVRITTVLELDAAPPSFDDPDWTETVDSVLQRLSTKIPVVNFAKWSRKSMPYIGGKSVVEVVESIDRDALAKLESQLLATR
jgi:hypothetical protein